MFHFHDNGRKSIPSRKLTYPTWGKGKSSSNMPYQGDMLIPWRVLLYRPIRFGDSCLPMAYPNLPKLDRFHSSPDGLPGRNFFAPTEGGGRAKPIRKMQVKFASFPQFSSIFGVKWKSCEWVPTSKVLVETTERNMIPSTQLRPGTPVVWAPATAIPSLWENPQGRNVHDKTVVCSITCWFFSCVLVYHVLYVCANVGIFDSIVCT